MKHFLPKHEMQEALKHTLSVMAGYVFLGFAFGLLMRTAGYPAWCPIVMSIVIYSGALEFAAVPLLASVFDPIGTFLLGLMLSARHLFYGISLLKKYQHTSLAKPFLIFGLTDETFSVLTAPGDGEEKSKEYCIFVTLFNYLYWNVGTALGALFGGLAAFDLSGLEFTLTALFIVLFLEQIKSKTGKVSGAIGIVASVAACLFFGKEQMVLASMGLILASLLAGRRVIDRE